MLGRNARNLGHNRLDLGHINHAGSLADRLETLIGTRLVNHIDGLVWHMPVVDVTGCQLGGSFQGLIGIADAMVFLKAALEPLENLDSVIHRGFDHIHLLETPGQGTVFLEDAAKLLKGC